MCSSTSVLGPAGGPFPIYGPRGDACGRDASGRITSGVLVTVGIVVVLTILFGWRLRQDPHMIYQGTVTMRGENGVFTTCGDSNALRINNARGAVARIYHEVAGEAGSPVFAEVRGVRRGNSLTVTQLRRMEPESRGCTEDLSGVEFRACGNEPFWYMDAGLADTFAYWTNTR